jgi:hypothetical protein
MSAPLDETNIVYLAGQGAGFMKRLLGRLPEFLYMLKELLTSVVTISLYLGFLAIVYILVYYVRPNIPRVCHSFDYDEYMPSTFTPDLLKNMRVFKEGLRFAPLILSGEKGATVNIRVDSSRAYYVNDLLQMGDREFRRNVLLSFMFYKSFVQDSWFNHGIFNQIPEFQDDEEKKNGQQKSSESKIEAFKTGFFDKLFALGEITKEISERCDNVADAAWYQSDPEKAFEWCMSAHRLRMCLIEYQSDMTFALMSRQSTGYSLSWQGNMWLLYYTPVVKDLWNRIGRVWKGYPKRLNGFYKMYDNGWKSLGNTIVNIPCYCIFEGADRAQYCNMDLTKNKV